MTRVPTLSIVSLLALIACKDRSGIDDSGPDSPFPDDPPCDEDAPPTWYGDADGDGFGGTTFTVSSCEEPGAPYVDNADDCDDLQPTVHPGADEICDGFDNDCDGGIDNEALDRLVYYPDVDGDGFGDDGNEVLLCEPDGVHIEDAGDCDDGDAAINPEADEICNDGLDNDCDGEPLPCLLPAQGSDLMVSGEAGAAHAGISLGLVGDVTGDGVPDLVVNAYRDPTNGADAGATYLFAGPVDASGALSLASADYIFRGAEDTRLGQEVGGSGDLNGDGIADLVIPAGRESGPHTKNGSVYIVHGPISAGIDFRQASTAARVDGVTAWERAGMAARVLEDFNGDGVADLAVGAPYRNLSSALSSVGAVYLVQGSSALGPNGRVDLENATATWTGVYAGQGVGQVIGSGDINGDGLTDMLVGVPSTLTSLVAEGAAYVIDGDVAPVGGTISGNPSVQGDTAGLLLGRSVAGVGDVNGDGFEDMAIGMSGYSGGGASNAGAVMLVYGSVAGLTATSPADADVLIYGTSTDAQAGGSVAGGDYDGDNLSDLIIGASTGGSDGQGLAYLVMGADLEPTVALEATAVVTVQGEQPGDRLGVAVRLDDVNQDGRGDLLFGADAQDSNGSDAGRAYIVFDIGL